MAYAYQLDLFLENDEFSLLRGHIDSIDKKYSNVQRGIFAKHGELLKLILKQQDEIDKLKYMVHTKKEVIDFRI